MILAWFPIRFDYLQPWQVVVLYLLLAAPILWMGIRSINGLDPIRKWTSIGLRLALLMLLVLMLAGARRVKPVKDLTVVMVRDVSQSVQNVKSNDPGGIQADISRYVTAHIRDKPPDDRVGFVRFDGQAWVNALPDTMPGHGISAIHAPSDGTNIAQALELAMAIMPPDTMHRIVLFSDGNSTSGDLQQAITAAAAQHVPVDVMPLHYKIEHEISISKLISPASARQGAPFTLDVIIRSQNPAPVRAKLSLTDNGAPFVMQHANGRSQTSRDITLVPGENVEHLQLPAESSGTHDFRVVVEPLGSESIDTMPQNNTAEAMTLVLGKSKVLYVQGPHDNGDAALQEALAGAGIAIEAVDAASVPQRLTDLQGYDAVILDNVPRGWGGLNPAQALSLCQYVTDMGGGLMVIGGPDSLGAGGWIGSQLEKVLPVNCQPPARQVMPAGALVLVIDHSGSMAESLDDPRMNKEQAADESAVLALKVLSPQDQVGVIAFDTQPTWVVPLGPNTNSAATAAAIRKIAPAGGTDIYPALVAADEAISRLSPRDAPIRHVLLLTDGQSMGGNFDQLIARMAKKDITLSTVGVGRDVDEPLLRKFAQLGRGRFYRVSKAAMLPRIFVKEAMTLRNSLIREQAFIPQLHRGVSALMPGVSALPRLLGMVRTWAKPEPGVQVPITSDAGEPVLADWRVGLGQVAVFTSDASRRWAPDWVTSPIFGKFWTQLIRGIARPAISATMDTSITPTTNGRLRIRVQTVGADNQFQNFLRMAAKVFAPEANQAPRSIHLSQVGPGEYAGEFDATEPGAYLAMITFAGEHTKPGWTAAAHVVNGSAEWHDLQSNDPAMRAVAESTGGRIIEPFDPDVNFFDRHNLQSRTAGSPITNQLLVLTMIVLLLDVASRRLAWDRQSLAAMASAAAQWIRSHTHVQVSAPSPAALGALKAIHESHKPDSTSTLPHDVPAPRDRMGANTSMFADPSHATASTPPIPHGNDPKPSSSNDSADPFVRLAAAKRRAHADHDADHGAHTP